MDPSGFAASFVPLWGGDRGGHPDFVRWGAFAACDAAGELRASAGNPDLVAFLRSSAKPFQAVAFLRRGLPRPLGLGEAEIACACASHEGEEKHVEAARRILAAAGMSEAALLCGTHAPSKDLERRIVRGETQLAAVHNNCSGKHAAMLAVCRHEGWPTTSYTDPAHPLQRENLATLAAFCGVAPESVVVAVDNCTVPTFGIPLRAAARGFARLLDPRELHVDLGRAAGEATRAMAARPDMVGGEGRLDTALMERTRGRVVAKTGANGYYAAAGRPPGGGADVLGFALKLSGGENETQKAPAVLGALEQAGLLSRIETEDLLARFAGPQLDCRGAVVGGQGWIGSRAES
jgi:L-asparaginase II